MTEEQVEFMSTLIDKRVDETLADAIKLIKEKLAEPSPPPMSMMNVVDNLEFSLTRDGMSDSIILAVRDRSSGYRKLFPIRPEVFGNYRSGYTFTTSTSTEIPFQYE